jgi:sporulation protein YlmC with PRC-barrel domain
MHTTLKRRVLITLMVPVLSLPMAMSAFAADTDKTAATDSASRKGYRDIRASTLIGQNVENAQGENLGEIKDLIIDVNNERVFYAVLEFGGFLGMGEKLFAYPMRVFKHKDGTLDKLVLNVDKGKLKAAPGFARDNWPDWLTYGDEVDRYYGETVKLKEMPNQKLRRASELIGQDVNDRAGKDIGEIEDIVVNMNNGKVHYAVLEFDQSWNLNDKLISLPLRAFTYAADDDDLILNVDKAAIDTKRAFDKDRWPDLNDQAYVVDVDRYLTTVVRSAPAGTPEAMFMRIDRDSDGIISKAEANSEASVKKAWAKLDKDQDGRVSRADFLAYKWK